MTTKTRALPKHSLAADFDKAVKDLRAIVGDGNLVVDEARLAPYNKIMMPVPNEQHAPSAAITPESVESTRSRPARPSATARPRRCSAARS